MFPENCPNASPKISAFSIGSTWTQIRQLACLTLVRSSDLETTLQYQLMKNDEHELAMLLGLIVDWGGTGATNSGVGTPYSLLTPNLSIFLARIF